MGSWIWELGPTSKKQFLIKNPFKKPIFDAILDLGSRADFQKAIFELKILLKKQFFGAILDLGTRADLQKAIF